MSKSKGNPFCVCGHRRTDHQINYNLKTFEACLLLNGTPCICKGFVEDSSDERTRNVWPVMLRGELMDVKVEELGKPPRTLAHCRNDLQGILFG